MPFFQPRSQAHLSTSHACRGESFMPASSATRYCRWASSTAASPGCLCRAAALNACTVLTASETPRPTLCKRRIVAFTLPSKPSQLLSPAAKVKSRLVCLARRCLPVEFLLSMRATPLGRSFFLSLLVGV